MRWRWDAKNNPRECGMPEVLGRDYGIEELFLGPSKLASTLKHLL